MCLGFMYLFYLYHFIWVLSVNQNNYANKRFELKDEEIRSIHGQRFSGDAWGGSTNAAVCLTYFVYPM